MTSDTKKYPLFDKLRFDNHHRLPSSLALCIPRTRALTLQEYKASSTVSISRQGRVSGENSFLDSIKTLRAWLSNRSRPLTEWSLLIACIKGPLLIPLRPCGHRKVAKVRRRILNPDIHQPGSLRQECPMTVCKVHTR